MKVPRTFFLIQRRAHLVRAVLVFFLAGNLTAGDPPAAGQGAPLIPQPTIITQPGFKPRNPSETLGIDGKPLEDHKIFSIDTSWFIRKIEAGISKMTKAEDKERLQALQALVSCQEIIRNITEDLAEGSAFAKAEKTLASKKSDLEGDSARFEQRYGMKSEQCPEYPVLDSVSQLRSAQRAYDQAEGIIHYEEQTTAADRLRLDGSPTPRGGALRKRMRTALARMIELRAQITSRHASYLEAGHLEEEGAGGQAP